MSVPVRTPARWRPSAFLMLSAAVHLAAGIGLLLAPAQWAWWLGALIVNHGLITAAGLLPRCNWLGPNLTRLPPAAAARGEVALTFDDGPDPAITPQVLDMLDAAGVRASFFCIGERVAAHPALARESGCGGCSGCCGSGQRKQRSRSCLGGTVGTSVKPR